MAEHIESQDESASDSGEHGSDQARPAGQDSDAAAEVRDRFILHWGQMAPNWGVSRTVAQVHALLYVSPEPLDAQTIMDELSISRGNVSMAVNELIAWGIVQRVHRLGERKEYYTSESDVWQMLRTVLRERKRREVDPTVQMLRDALADLEGTDAEHERERLGGLLQFFELGGHVFEAVEDLSPGRAMSVARQVISAIRRSRG